MEEEKKISYKMIGNPEMPVVKAHDPLIHAHIETLTKRIEELVMTLGSMPAPQVKVEPIMAKSNYQIPLYLITLAIYFHLLCDFYSVFFSSTPLIGVP